ncbi:MAG: TonB-dependent receptor [Prolixibacteraceae bacterium]
MRIMLFVLFAAVSQVFATNLYSQSTRLSLNMKDSEIKDVLQEIENRTSFFFMYNAAQVNVSKKVNIECESMPVSEILKELFRDTNVIFEINNRQIALTVSEGRSMQPVGKVSGTVTDSSGDVLPGVAITIKGITQGTVSDFEGKYTLSNVPDNAILVFSFVGMRTKEISVAGKALVNVELEEETIGIEEVVAVGYGSMKKVNLTGAISNIQSEDLNRSRTSTVSQALIGKMAGVQTRLMDGRPGASAQLQIRNLGTPLYIIDGIPGTASDFNNIDVNDIENISVLKDASAAIYGIRAGNGVVLITTKLGVEQKKPRININAYYGLQGFTRFPQQANAYQYMRGLAESSQNLRQATTITPEELGKWKEGKKLSDGDYRSMDYLDYMIGSSPQIYINPSATGGTDRFKYHFSLSHLDQKATIESYFFKRSSVQANLEASLAKGFRIGTQISGRVEHRHQAGVPGDDYSAVFNVITKMWPTERPYANDNPKYINSTHSINVNPATYVEDVTGWNDVLNRVVRTNLYGIYDFDFGLQIKGTYSYQYAGWTDDGQEKTYDAYKYDPASDTYHVVMGGGNQNPIRRTSRRNIEDKFAQLQVSYDKTIKDHSVSAVIAYERSENDNTYLFARTVPKTNYMPIMLFEELNSFTDEWTQQARASYIGRFNYNYKGRYLLEFLGRYDGSYLYSSDKRWGFFPGISMGWRISDESFFTSTLANVFSDLKLRVSYGQVGSETGVSAYDYLGGFNWAQGNYMFDGNLVTGIQPRGLPVTNLSWVTMESINLGLDFSFLKNKLSGQLDLFKRKVTGIPAAKYDVLLPSEVGYTLPNENLNSTANLGIEGMIQYRGNVRDLNYSVGINATLSRQKLLHTYKPRFGNLYDEYRNSTEMRWGENTWGYHCIGQFQSQEEIDTHPVNIDGQGNRTLLPGDLIYEDFNGDNIVNSYDEQPISYRTTQDNPYLNFGVSSSFYYKGFSIAMDFSGATMQSFFLNRELKIPYYDNGNSPAFLLEDRWHREDPFDPSSAWIPGTYPAVRKNMTSHSNFKTNDFYHVNMTYFRMKNFEIGYDFPFKFFGNTTDSNIRIYTNISNLFSIDNVGKKFGIDPEVADFGGRVYPQTRVYNFGLVLSL